MTSFIFGAIAAQTSLIFAAVAVLGIVAHRIIREKAAVVTTVARTPRGVIRRNN